MTIHRESAIFAQNGVKSHIFVPLCLLSAMCRDVTHCSICSVV